MDSATPRRAAALKFHRSELLFGYSENIAGANSYE